MPVADSRPPPAAPRSGRIAEADLAEHEARLFETSRRLFYERGYEGTSVESIARIAHVSPKTIYGRFGGKSGLFAAVMHARADLVLAPLQNPIAGIEDVRAALVEFATRLLTVTTLEESLDMQRVAIAEARRFPEFAEAFLAAGPERGIATVAAFVERAIDAGVIAACDSRIAAEIFGGALLGVPIRHALLTRKHLTRAAIATRAAHVVDFFLRAAIVRVEPMPAPSAPSSRRTRPDRRD